MQITAFDNLINQLDLFIRKYYKNQMIKGLLFFVGIFLLSFLIAAGLEFFGRFNSSVRAVLFYSFLLINCIIFIQFIVIPITKLFAFGKRINYYQASQIIGDFFPDISDKLLNTLQLKDTLTSNPTNVELLKASINQRAKQFSTFSFRNAINFKENLVYLKWVLPVFLLFLLVFVFLPDIITKASTRVVNYSKNYVIPAPFQFHLIGFNHNLEEGSDLELKLQLKGSEIPQKVYLISNQGKQLMTLLNRNEFQATLFNLKDNGKFTFQAGEFSSKIYSYHILKKPFLGLFKAHIDYPKYLNRKPEIVSNASDIVVPEGSLISWDVAIKNTNQTNVFIADKKLSFKENNFRFSKKFNKNTPVSIIMNSLDKIVDTFQFQVQVIPDAYPTIVVDEKVDSTASGVRRFSGAIHDDYGLKALNFYYIINHKDGSKRKERIPVQAVSGLEQSFQFAVDFNKEKINLEDRIEYYFVVSDNDGVNGSKSTKSSTFVYQLPNLNELNNQVEKTQENAKQNLQSLVQQSKLLQESLNQLKQDLLNSKSSNWKHQNQLNQIREQFNQLKKQVQHNQEQLKQNDELKNQLTEQDQAFLEKQKLLQQLLEQVVDDELKKLLDELQKMMEKNQKVGEQNTLEKIELSTDDMNKQLDRSLEMLKEMQINEKIDALEDELNQLSKKQDELKNKIDNKHVNKQEAVEEQSKINKQFQELKDDLQQLNKLNNELKRPLDIPSLEQESQAIQQELNDAHSNLSKGKSNKGQENQSKASEQMQSLANQLNTSQNQSNQQKQGEDIRLLREILESLVTLSFNQESTMNDFEKVQTNDPLFKNHAMNQRAIIDNTKSVIDSLNKLALRQPIIATFINKEVRQIQNNQQLALKEINERNIRKLLPHQQLAMTSYNNLALMLNESLQQMQKQMQSMMQGSGSCSKPGGTGKPGVGESQNMGDMKEMLKKQLEQMKKGSQSGGQNPGNQKGQQPGGNKSGSSGFMGMSNKQLAKMAAEQAVIRQYLEELKNQFAGEKGVLGKLDKLQDALEKQQNDLIYKNQKSDLIERQEEIMTRLLESEKAIRERGFDKKRESKSGKNQNYSNQIRFDEYNKEKLKQIELLRSIDPIYNQYYKNKANQYFNSN